MAVYKIKKEYDWKIQMPVQAQIAGEELEKIETENGNLTAELVLENSRDENAVLHPCFEWNDSIAAENYRLVQAGNIIRNITVKVTTTADDNQPKEICIRSFVNVSEEKQGKYIAIQTALSQEKYRERVLKNALNELRMFRNKYSVYTELTNVCKAIDNFEETLKA